MSKYSDRPPDKEMVRAINDYPTEEYRISAFDNYLLYIGKSKIWKRFYTMLWELERGVDFFATIPFD